MLAHIQSCLPEEGCGILAGRGDQVERVIPITNELHSPVRFRMAPREQLDALIWLDDHHADLTAIFHSHPGGPPFPSETDLAEFFYPESAALILSPLGGGWQMRAFRVRGREATEIEIVRT